MDGFAASRRDAGVESVRPFSLPKRAMDIALALPLLLASGPMLVAVAVANRVSGDRGPLLHRSTRVGENGAAFQLLKLRTMRVGMQGSQLTQHEDPRITPVGRCLRQTKLDEMPQLWNVLRGQMSLVGPRPESPDFVDWADPVQAVVFRARPGITGVTQLEFSDEETLHVGDDPVRRYRREILPRKVQLDHWYLAHQSVRLDIRILLRTGRLMLGRLTETWSPDPTAD